MLIASWNLAKRTARGAEMLDHLEGLSVDIALLQESRIHKLAEKRGWTVIRAAYSPSDCVVMARREYILVRAAPSALSQLGRYVAHAQLRLDDRVVDLVSVHPLAKIVPVAEIAHLPIIDVQRKDPGVWYSDLFFYLLGHASLAGRPS